MTFIDMKQYQEACEAAHELVDPISLMDAIYRVYEMWFEDMRQQKKVVFHAYFGLSLLDMGIETLVEAERYRKALAAYFQPRALRKIRQMHATAPRSRTVPANPVEFASAARVRVRVGRQSSLEFMAGRRTGTLTWQQVQERFTVRHQGADTIPDAIRHAARVQALAIMNEKRMKKRD